MDTACRALESTVGKEKRWSRNLNQLLVVSGFVLDLACVAAEDTAVINNRQWFGLRVSKPNRFETEPFKNFET